MSQQIPTHFVTQYTTNVQLLLQQRGSKLRNAVMTSSHTGKLLWDRLEVDVSVLENVVINRSASGIGQPAPLVAEAAAFALHGFEPSSSGYKLYCSAVTPESDAQILIYNVRFFTGAIAAQPSRLT